MFILDSVIFQLHSGFITSFSATPLTVVKMLWQFFRWRSLSVRAMLKNIDSQKKRISQSTAHTFMVWVVHGSIHSPHLYGVGCPRLNPQPTPLWCGLSTAQSTAHTFTVWVVHGSIHSPHLYGVGCPRLNPQPTPLWCGLSTAQSTAHTFTVWVVHGSIHSPHLYGVGCPRLNPQLTPLRCGLSTAG